MNMNIKKIVTISVIIYSSVISSVYVKAEESVAADRETARLTAKILIGELKKNIIKSPIPKGLIYDELTKNKEKYRSFAESKGLIKMFVQNELEKKFIADVKGVIDSLNSNLPEGQKNWFSEEELKEFYKFPKTKVLNNLDKQFPKIYRNERRRACNSQWKLLTMDVYPTESEFTSLDARDLYDLLLRRILTKQKEPLFEESERYLKTEFIKPIIADAQAQLNLQIKILASSKGGDNKLPKDIESAITNELEKARRSLRRKKSNKKIGNKVYKVFKMVADKIPYRARDLAASKFDIFLNKTTLPINSVSIQRTINEDITAHVSPKQSFEICLNKYKTDVIDRAVQLYLNGVDDKNGKFHIFIRRLLSDDKQVQASANNLVRRSLSKGFEKARLNIVNEQMNEFFLPLKIGKWTPSYSLIEKEFYKVGPIVIDDPLDIAGISSVKFNRSLLIDETVGAVKTAIQNGVVEGHQAMKAQFGLVDDIEQKIIAELRKLEKRDTNSITCALFTFFKEESLHDPAKDVSDTQRLIGFYKARLIREWREKRVKLIWPDAKKRPQNYLLRYKEPFVAVETAIVRRVKSILHNDENFSVTKLKQITNGTENTKMFTGGGRSKRKGGNSTGSGAGIGTGVGDVESDVLIDLKVIGDKVEVTLNFANRKYPVKVILPQRKYGAELNPITNAFETWIAENAKKGEEVRMDVVMRIFNSDIRYGLVAEIRRRLKHLIAKLHDQEINIQWTDMLYTDE